MNDDDAEFIKYEINYIRAKPLKTLEDLINYLGTLGLFTHKPIG